MIGRKRCYWSIKPVNIIRKEITLHLVRQDIGPINGRQIATFDV